MPSFLSQLLAPGTKAPRWFTALIVLILCGAGWWYVTEALAHGKRANDRIDHMLTLERQAFFKGDNKAMEAAGRPSHAYDLNDQRVYMNYAMGMQEFGFDMFTTRMRMPMFMWALGTVAEKANRSQMDYYQLEAQYKRFFPVARAFNITLSVFLLITLFFALRRWLGNWLGLAFVLIAAFNLYIMKSPYVQPEMLQTTIITVTVAWVCLTLCETTWKNALVTGLLLCFWHMTKANALVALAGMGGLMGLKLLYIAWRRQDAWKQRSLQIIIAGLVTLVAYVTPMSPYLYKSYITFGSPFYNVQSKYFMWAKDSKEKAWLQKISIDRNLWEVDKDGDLKVDHPDLLPSAGKYWREHTWKHIKTRIARGIEMMLETVFEEYTAITWLQMLWVSILIWASARRWTDTVEGIRRYGLGVAYVVLLLTAFIFLFGWFTPLKVGPRLTNSISLIPLAFCMAGTRWLLRNDTVTIRGTVVSTEKLLVLCFLPLWLALTTYALPPELEIGYFAG